MREAGEGGLAVLAESNVFVRLELLEPGTEIELMLAVRPTHAVFVGIEVARDGEIAAVVAAGKSYLRLRIGGRASTYHHRADGLSKQESWNVGRWRTGRRLTSKEVSGTRKAKAGNVQQGGREDVRPLQTQHLLLQAQNVGAVRVSGGRREVVAVVDGVHR